MKNGKHFTDLDALARESAQAAIKVYEDRERKRAFNMRCAFILGVVSLLVTIGTASVLLERYSSLDSRIIIMERYAARFSN